ncbi:unnamed protein product, partial [marine sediment metagenome]
TADIHWDDSENTLFLGVTDEGLDLKWWGDTAGDFVLFDQSADLVYFEDIQLTMMDDTPLGFGDGASQAGDFTISSDGTALLIAEVAAAGKQVLIGVDDEGLDMKWYGATASSYMLWDASGDQLLLDAATIAMGDGDAILLGDTLGTGDFSISSTSAVLSIAQVAAGTGTISIGVDNKGIDISIFGETSGDLILFDQSDDRLIFEDIAATFMDDTPICFGDGASNAGDFTMLSDGTSLLIAEVVANGADIQIGVDG